jgi:hypothetical protein
MTLLNNVFLKGIRIETKHHTGILTLSLADKKQNI